MLNRVTHISDSLSGGSDTSGDADAGPIADVLTEGESVGHVIANSGTIEYTNEGRSTTVEANGDSNAYGIITDSRVLFILGDKPDEVEIEFDLAAVTMSQVRSSLLSSKLVVKTDDEAVVFAPDEGDIEAAADYIERVGSCWSDALSAFRQARAKMDTFEERCAAGRDPKETALGAKSHLSKARHAATRDEDAPTVRLQQRIGDVVTEIDHRRVEAWLDRLEADVETATEAHESGAWDLAALSALVDAKLASDRTAETIDDVDYVPEGAEARQHRLAERVESLATAFLDDMEAAIEAARATDDPTEAADHWTRAAEGYRAAVAADWDGLAGISNEALAYQRTWIDAKCLEELTSQAAALEAKGDEADDNEAARECFETAEAVMDRALEVAAANAPRRADALEEDLDRLEEKKLDSSGWEFGAA